MHTVPGLQTRCSPADGAERAVFPAGAGHHIRRSQCRHRPAKQCMLSNECSPPEHRQAEPPPPAPAMQSGHPAPECSGIHKEPVSEQRHPVLPSQRWQRHRIQRLHRALHQSQWCKAAACLIREEVDITVCLPSVVVSQIWCRCAQMQRRDTVCRKRLHQRIQRGDDRMFQYRCRTAFTAANGQTPTK